MSKFVAFVTMVLLAASMGFAGGQQEPATSEAPMEEAGPEAVHLTLSTIATAEAAAAKAFEKFKFEVGRRTNGRITAEVFTGGQIFTQEGEIAAAREGTLDIANYAPGWVAEFVPYLGQLGAVYTFSSYEHMRNVYTDEEIWGQISADVEENVGVVPMTALYLGTRELNLVESVGPVRHPDDMESVKLRTPNSATWIALGRALGGNPTPMSFGEVYMGLKTGVIEGQDNPLNTDVVQKFYEPTKYIIMTDHVVDTIWPCMNAARWNSLSAEDQEIILQAWEVARDYNDQLVQEREAEARAFMEEEGIVFIDDPDKDAFIEYAKWSYQNESQNVSKNWDWDFYDRIQALRPGM
jgi:tripartite ATP-independent transporter DctP family solute receptor